MTSQAVAPDATPEDAGPETCRLIGELTVTIDRNLCVGFGDCVDEAPEAFRMDAEDIVIFTQPETVERQRLLGACAACPVDAITVTDAEGRTLVP